MCRSLVYYYPDDLYTRTKMTQSNFWLFTYNNPTHTPDEIIELFTGHVDYLVFQLEVGENGTPHYQGYMELTTRKRLSTVRRILQAHYSIRRGTRRQAREYCMKEDTRTEGPWEHGEWNPVGEDDVRGQRNDLIGYKDAIRSGKRKRELIDEYTAEVAKYPRFYVEVLSTVERSVRIGLIVELHVGDTGTGKTRQAFERFPDLYKLPISNGTLWFDGYDRHDVILIDDFSGAASKVSLVNLLQLLDIYPTLIPVKGAHVYLDAMRIIITTNIHPKKWYNYNDREEQYWALLRRFTNCSIYSNSEIQQIEIPREIEELKQIPYFKYEVQQQSVRHCYN